MGEAFVARFYTAARKIKTLVGEFNGTRLPGGPYSVLQIVVFVAAVMATFALLANHISVTSFPILDLPLYLAADWGLAWLCGRFPQTRRNPVFVVTDAAGAFTAPAEGTYRGVPFRTGGLHRRRPLDPHGPDPFPEGAAPTGPGRAPAPRPVAVPAAAPAPAPEIESERTVEPVRDLTPAFQHLMNNLSSKDRP